MANILIAVVLSGVISLILFLVLRTDLRTSQESLRHLEGRLRFVDADRLRRDAETLRSEFQKFGTDLIGKVDAFKRLSAEEMARLREDVLGLAEQRSVDAAVSHVREVSVTREEFERLRTSVEKLGGHEELAERLELVGRLFDSTELRVLNWQSQLIRLLEGGLAPEAEQDQMLASGIPLGAGEKFLRRMAELELVSKKNVVSYWLQPEYLWLRPYTQDPAWLKRQLETLVLKEKDYQEFIRDHLNLVEDGLVLVAEQHELPSGRVDLLCRDVAGADVLVELKYPTTGSAVVGQLLRYREEYAQTSGGRPPRAILTAPRVPERLRDLLRERSLEWREVSES